jgi:prepilin-type N-terminal cleavage/methylation domain-containing protein
MRRAGGFTLIEILAAITIFAFIAAVAMATMANAGYLSSSGVRSRQLRTLAERKLGEVLLFESHYDDIDDGDFGDYEDLGEEFRDWKWQLDIRDVTVFGVSSQADAQYLFGEPTDEEKTQATSGGGGNPGSASQQQKKGETQTLRELTLRVSAPAEDGSQDSVEILEFMPPVKAKAAK